MTWKQCVIGGGYGLTPEAAAFLSDKRPAEEFYDLKQDPHEVRNLVGDPLYAAELQRHMDILRK